MEVLIAFCTSADSEVARKVVRGMVDSRLVACGSIIPKIHSIYRWQGKVESSDEALAIFKLGAVCYAKFESRLRSLHPYDVPEIISCKIDKGLPEYLSWVAQNCAT